ncbi:hypothetical protein MRX96_032058 [Rhipicephalus microplus]
MWNDVRRGLPRKKRDPPKGGLLLLGDAVVEERQQKVLRLGPKFCVEPRLDLVDKLSLTRDIARQVPEKEKDRCVVECVDVVAKASVFREWCRQANILTEAMWNDVRRGLPRKKRDPPKGGLLLLGDAVVEERQQKVLRLGPKFCVEPRLDLVDKLSLTRDIARQVPEKEKDRCVVECVDVVAKASLLVFAGLVAWFKSTIHPAMYEHVVITGNSLCYCPLI